MRRVEVLVLGAGPTGLGAAVRLAESTDTSWLAVEAAAVPGGAAASWRDDQGFLWDMGGHVLHSHFPYFDAVLARSVPEWTHPVRNPAVWTGRRFVDAPIQQHLDQLGADVEEQIRKELADRDDEPQESLAAWFAAEFGPTLTELFLTPFNHRMWAYPPAQMEHDWTSLRSGSGARNVPPPGSVGPRRLETFPYPRGGNGSIWTAVADQLPAGRLQLGTAAELIDLDHRVVTLSDGQDVAFDECISSVPLPSLAHRLVGHDELHQQMHGLHHSAVEMVGFGFEGTPPPGLADRSWIYTADPDVLMHRATVLSNYSDLMAGPGRWSVLCEIGTSDFRPVDPDDVTPNSLAALRRWGVEADPVSVTRRRVPLGYPVPALGRDAVLRPLHDGLEQLGFRSRGRFGGWRYESCNQDYSFMQGVEAVDAIATGSPEDVFWHPERF